MNIPDYKKKYFGPKYGNVFAFGQWGIFLRALNNVPIKLKIYLMLKSSQPVMLCKI